MAKNEDQLHPLLCAALKGDQLAYAKLLQQIGDIATRYARRKIGAHGDVDDVVQEILISVHKALHTYDPARPCMPWLAAIMHFRLSDWLRKTYRNQTASHVPIEDVQDFLAADVTADPREHEYLTKEVEKLSDSQQAVIHAMYREELSVQETSEKLGMSVSNVKVTAHRAYNILRKRISHDE
ncbi:MAG: sigma-70 family RNA polymerase sigma factor [Rickettsiales bacterium]